MSISTKRPPRVEVEKRAFQQVYDDMNQVIDAVNADEATESRNTESGNTGDIRLVKNGSASKYFIEGKFSDGWAQREMFFSKAVASESSDEDIATANIDDLKVIKSATFKIQPKQDSAVATTPGDDYTLTTKAYVDGLTGSNVQIGSASDTNISSPASAHMLIYDGTDTWDNKAISGDVTIGADGVTVVANDSHTHDTIYYTETELNAGQLDNRYYTETEFASVSQGSAGANLVAVYQSELAHSGSTNVQDVLDDLDAAITTASLTYGVATSVNAAGADFDLVPSTGSSSTVIFAGGTNISIAQSTSPETITITNDINPASFMTNGIVTILAVGGDLDTVNASGGDTLKFASGGGITWDAAGSGDVITVTPSVSGLDNYSSWTIKDHDGTTYPVTSGDTLWIKEGTGIDVNFTADDTLTITNTSTNTDTKWEGDSSSLLGSASVARTTLGLGAAATAAIGASSGQVAAGDHTHSGYLATSVFEAHPAYGIGVGEMSYIGDLTDDNTDGCTGDQTKGDIGLDTDDDVRFDSFGVGTNASGTTGEIRATNEITAYYSDDRLKDKHGNIKKALEKVCSLNGFHYSPNDIAGSLGYDTDEKKVGVSAQEVLKVLPEAVTPAPIDPQYHTVQYDKLIPLMIEAIKELSERKCSCGV